MRSLLLAGLLGVLIGLCPRPSGADHVSEIFLDFPELAEWGRPVSIGGYAFWQPHPAYLPAGWEPYTNGYLYEDPEDGLTWVSEDPWGFITEHYGYWRHHEVYGFVWRPLYPIEWRPYVASLFRDGGNRIVGWCPFYYDAWDHGYYLIGFGFNDYYWGPFWSRVHYADFYTHHWWRFHGYYVGVTIYDYDRYYRPVPGPCHRRDREYRHRRQRERHGEDKRGGMAVRSELPARPAAATPTRSRTGPDASGPSRSPRQVGVSTGELRVPSREAARPARAVTAPARETIAPARQSSVARERQERMQLLRDRMRSAQSPAVATRRPAQPSSPSRATAAPSVPQRSSPPATSWQRGNLDVRRASPATSRPSNPAPRPATHVAPRQAAPSRPAVQARPPQPSRVERAREALPAKRGAKSKRN